MAPPLKSFEEISSKQQQKASKQRFERVGTDDRNGDVRVTYQQS
jgi:hypothetical protein